VDIGLKTLAPLVTVRSQRALPCPAATKKFGEIDGDRVAGARTPTADRATHHDSERDTGRAMSEESTTPDLVELTRRSLDAANRHHADALMRFYAPDAVFDVSDAGMGTFEGVATIKSFLEDWWATWGDHSMEVEEILELGHGVVFIVVREDGRLAGSDGHVEQRRGWVLLWVQSLIGKQMGYLDIDQGRAAAERLPESRA
jgi:ketosteroid isomerase-like protein